MEVRTIQTFKDYEFSYEVERDGDVQPYKGFAAIIAAYDELENNDMGNLYMLSMNQKIPKLNPEYDKDAKVDEKNPVLEFIDVDYIEKGEGETLVKFKLKKIVNYDKEKEVVHQSKQEVVKPAGAFTFMEKTAAKFTKHTRIKVDYKKLDNSNIKKAIILELPEDTLKDYQEDGTNQSSILAKLEMYYYYR